MSGSGSAPGITPCGSLFPQWVTVAARTMSGEKQVVVQCNRPYGHDGNCAHSTYNRARAYEWSPGVIVRSK
jgi:hypothetical protein